MIDHSKLIQWMEQANQRYSAADMPHRRRPFAALSDFTRDHQCSLRLDDPIAKMMFDWFYEHSPPGAHQLGSVYSGAYLYDAAFWPINVPLIYGQVSINAFDCLSTMPLTVKKHLNRNHQDVINYVNHWVNCMDYAYGHMDLYGGSRLKPRTLSFLNAADSELRGAISQLIEPRLNVRAILGLRMAAEIFLKSCLVQELELTEAELRNISHDLADAAMRCADVTKENTFNTIATRVAIYPPISARYEEPKWPIGRVWEAVALTQLTAAAVTRLYTDRDMRSGLVGA